MADTIQVKKIEKAFYADDGAKRGPLSMARVRFHPVEATLLAQTADRRLALFDLTAEANVKGRGGTQHVPCSWVCPHEIGWVRGLAIHPQGTSVATGGSDRTLRIWKWLDGRPAEQPERQIIAHDGWVECIAYSSDGELLATGGADGVVKVHRAGDLKLLNTLVGHKHAVFDVRFTKSSEQLVSGGEDGLCKVWDVAQGKSIRELSFGYANDQFGQNPRHSGVHRLSLSHDERWLAVAGGENVDLFDFAGGRVLAGEKPGMEAAFHPLRPLLGTGENELKLWQYDDAALIKLSESPPEKYGKPKEMPGKLLTTVKRGDFSLGVDFSADGKQLALGKADGSVELYELI